MGQSSDASALDLAMSTPVADYSGNAIRAVSPARLPGGTESAPSTDDHGPAFGGARAAHSVRPPPGSEVASHFKLAAPFRRTSWRMSLLRNSSTAPQPPATARPQRQPRRRHKQLTSLPAMGTQQEVDEEQPDCNGLMRSHPIVGDDEWAALLLSTLFVPAQHAVDGVELTEEQVKMSKKILLSLLPPLRPRSDASRA